MRQQENGQPAAQEGEPSAPSPLLGLLAVLDPANKPTIAEKQDDLRLDQLVDQFMMYHVPTDRWSLDPLLTRIVLDLDNEQRRRLASQAILAYFEYGQAYENQAKLLYTMLQKYPKPAYVAVATIVDTLDGKPKARYTDDEASLVAAGAFNRLRQRPALEDLEENHTALAVLGQITETVLDLVFIGQAS